MIFIFYILAGLLLFLSYRSFRGGLEYLKYFREELAKPLPDFAPFATVMVPCRGIDEGLEENLSALMQQDYPAYEVIFVVDDEDDAAVPTIENVSRKAAKNAKLVVSGKASESGQKVENLREAVLHRSDASEVFVFADSDVLPTRHWLRHLVAPLADERVGATTGYRWFISKRPDFPSELRSAWNASIATALGPNTGTNFCWGGSTAIRRGTFERLFIRERWQGTLSDDFTLTLAVREADLTLSLVPQAMTASIGNCTFAELVEFTTRQIKITRVYAPTLWKLSFFGSALFNVVMVSAFAALTAFPVKNIAFWTAAATMILISIFSIGKSYLRLRAVRLVLSEYEKELAKQTLPQCTLWAITPAVFLFNCVAALVSRRVTWRGTVYEMVSPTETRVVKSRHDGR